MDGLMRANGSTAGPSSVFPEVNGYHSGVTQPETLEDSYVARIVFSEVDGHDPSITQPENREGSDVVGIAFSEANGRFPSMTQCEVIRFVDDDIPATADNTFRPEGNGRPKTAVEAEVQVGAEELLKSK